ncbi:MAG: hypothetical protein WD737_00725 [Gemmatimonadota bacterium]
MSRTQAAVDLENFPVVEAGTAVRGHMAAVDRSDGEPGGNEEPEQEQLPRSLRAVRPGPPFRC